MTQTRWYIRVGQRSGGPYPVAQITEKILLGRLPPSAEVSQDAQTWQLILDVDLFEAAFRDLQRAKQPTSGEEHDWARERALAKQRWLDERVEARVDTSDSAAAAESQRIRALRRDQAETDALIEQAIHRKPSYWIALVALISLVGLAAGVWYGQMRNPDAITAQLASATNCAAMPAPGVAWVGCDKRGSRLQQASLKSAKLARVRLDDSDLSGADLSYADLKGASLRSVNLSGANLQAADLTGADLAGANLGQARLDYAVLQDATTDGVRLTGASLSKTVWVDGRLCTEGSLDVCQ